MPYKKSTCTESVCPWVGGLKSEKDTFSTFYLHDGAYFGLLEDVSPFPKVLVPCFCLFWVCFFFPLVGMTPQRCFPPPAQINGALRGREVLTAL